MRILSISSDRKMFEEKSAVRKRLLLQASIVEHLYVIVFSRQKENLEKLEFENVTLLPTNSRFKLFYWLDAYFLGKEINTDLITVQDPFESALAGVLLKRHLKKPLQIQAHTDFLSPEFRKDGILNGIRYLLAYITVPFADGFRVVSERIKRSLEKGFDVRNRVEVLPVLREFTRPDEAVFPNLHKKYPEFGFIILFVGRLEREKNLPLLLKSFAEALYMMPDAGLVIVGDGTEKEKLQALAKNLGIAEKVRFEGWRNNLIIYYESADLFVSASNYEGYGLTFLEAGYYGCPIISTDVGIMGEVFKDNINALICPVGDSECLRNKMAEMRKFGDVRRRIAAGGRVAARGAAWSRENYLLRLKKIWRKSIR